MVNGEQWQVQVGGRNERYTNDRHVAINDNTTGLFPLTKNKINLSFILIQFQIM